MGRYSEMLYNIEWHARADLINERLARLFSDVKSTDITLICAKNSSKEVEVTGEGQVKLRAHKFVLHLFTDYFTQRADDYGDGKLVVVRDISAHAMRKLLQ